MTEPEKYRTGIQVLDDLENAYLSGDDTEYIEAVREFVAKAKRLPRGGLLSHKYVERLLTLV